MAYLTPQEFYYFVDARVGQALSNDVNSPYGNAAATQAILDATASVIDSYIAGRVETYPIPAGSVPALLKLLNARLAQYEHFRRRPDMPKAMQDARDWAMDWLDKFAKGEVALPGVDRVGPALIDSDDTQGRSRWDYIYGQSPTDTGPSRGE